MKRVIIILIAVLSIGLQNIVGKANAQGAGTEWHVSVKGNDANAGTAAAPFRTINKAAQTAQTGDIITVHAGTYRECVSPPRSGVVYRAAPKEHVEIKGSERITSWEKVNKNVWKVRLPNSFFGNHNPYRTLIRGTGDVNGWFDGYKRIHHTGGVFLNGKALYEKTTLDEVIDPQPMEHDPKGSILTWYCSSDNEKTTIYANFQGVNPNRKPTEISVRESCFYPNITGVNNLTVRGFHFSQAATQWAPPSQGLGQVGIIATRWSKGWIIENNTVFNSRCAGITLGYTPEWFTEGNKMIWDANTVGSHIVRGNEIAWCEQAGICGQFGALNSVIEDNVIHDIWVQRQFGGYEIAGIKFHAANDAVIRHNKIFRCLRGIWIDMPGNQGLRITQNLLYNNLENAGDLMVEGLNGPFIVDNNIFASPWTIWDGGSSGLYVHNLFGGQFWVYRDKNRKIPFYHPHSTATIGQASFLSGGNAYRNNLFMQGTQDVVRQIKVKGYTPQKSMSYDLNNYSPPEDLPISVAGNVYSGKAKPAAGEESRALDNAGWILEEDGDKVYITITAQGLEKLLGEIISSWNVDALEPGTRKFESSDGSNIVFDKDYLGNTRSSKPLPGPFFDVGKKIRIW
ncbi:MAG: right-handed parallel beta-helix repeat-containing protein [Prevotellaceae bacterium]|jgi:hypothetical protein|nr:right-handed parallel beta-helix repeat-containing protein [Prevotellaceae bacterium]